MKQIFILLMALGLGACASQPTTHSSANSNSIYVKVVAADETEVFGSFADTIRDEAYREYGKLGMVKADNMADAAMIMVFKTNEAALKAAVNMKMSKTKVSTSAKSVYVFVRNEAGQELFNPIADTIREETYKRLAGQGYTRSNDLKDADMTVTMFTSDTALRAAVRKVIEHNPKTKAE